MAAIQKKKVYAPLNGGLNDTLSPVLIGNTEAAALVNCQVSDRAVLEKIEGFVKDHSAFPDDADSFIRMLVNYRRGLSVNDLVMAARDDGNTNATYKVDLKKTTGDGTSSYITHTAGTNASFINGNTAVTGVGTAWLSHLKAGDKIKASSHADSAYTEISSVTNDTTLVLVAGGYIGATAAAVAYKARIILNKDAIPNGVVFNDNLIITNGSEKPMTWNNTTLNKITDADCPSADFVTAHKNRIFMASTDGYPSRIYWSAVNDEATWDAASYEDVYPQDNGAIVAIKSFGDSLMVFKNNGKIYQVLGNFDQNAVGEVDYIRRIDSPENIGIIASKTVVVHDGFLYFLAETGLYAIDSRMVVEQATRKIDAFLDALNFTLGPTSAKSHSISSDAEFDGGTLSGMLSTNNGIQNHNESYTASGSSITEASFNAVATCLDTSLNLHVIYRDAATYATLHHKIVDVNGTVTTNSSIITDAYGTQMSLNCSVGGTIGLAYIRFNGSNYDLAYRTYSAGSWSSAAIIETGSPAFCSLGFRTDNSPRIVYMRSTGEVYVASYAGSWSTANISGAGTATCPPSLEYRTGTNTAMVAYTVYSTSYLKVTTDDFGTYTVNDSWSATPAISGWTGPKIFPAYDGTDYLAIYPSGGNIVKYNATSNATSTYVSGRDRLLGVLSAGDKVHLYYLHANSYAAETFAFENLGATLARADSYEMYNGAVQGRANAFNVIKHNSGYVFAAAHPKGEYGGTTLSGDIKYTRICYHGIYHTQEFSDSGLTAWGTFEETHSLNSGSITFSAAVSTTPAPSSYSTITDGTVVSSDAASVYLIMKVDSYIGDLTTTPIVYDLQANYTGTGIDCKQPCGVSYRNELYIGVAETSDDANSKVVINDIEDKYITADYPVSLMEPYKNQLYAGKSTNGDLLKLRTGTAFAAAAYGMDFQSKEDFLEGIELEKDIYKYYVLYEVKGAGTFTFSYRLDNFASAEGVDWTTTSIDMTTAGVAEISVGNKARSIQFRITDSSATNSPVILGVVLVYGTLNIR